MGAEVQTIDHVYGFRHRRSRDRRCDGRIYVADGGAALLELPDGGKLGVPDAVRVGSASPTVGQQRGRNGARDPFSGLSKQILVGSSNEAIEPCEFGISADGDFVCISCLAAVEAGSRSVGLTAALASKLRDPWIRWRHALPNHRVHGRAALAQGAVETCDLRSRQALPSASTSCSHAGPDDAVEDVEDLTLLSEGRLGKADDKNEQNESYETDQAIFPLRSSSDCNNQRRVRQDENEIANTIL
ncbi:MULTISPECIES: hypothetical protein [Bradyrhizobium]|uniref:hypothetical protein n=1 Tax=Bradyrhizobium TaxID=374 RepID=UPI001958CBA1|nr:hypothetical protein [Bradyrhizobium canariense]MBM7486100.1 hypothetical protein [Bradyrhizobium canariense]